MWSTSGAGEFLVLLDAPCEENYELFVGQSIEGADRKIHRHLAAVVTLKRDGHADRFKPPVRKSPGSR